MFCHHNGMLKADCFQPPKVGLRPACLARVLFAVSKQKRIEPLTGLALNVLSIGARTREVTDGFLLQVRHPHRRQLAGSVQPGQAQPIPTVRLHPLSSLARNQRRRHHRALMTPLGQCAVQSVATGP